MITYTAKRWLSVIVPLTVLVFCTALRNANADTTANQAVSREQEETRDQLTKTETLSPAPHQPIKLSYGGWLSSYFWRFEDKDSRKDNTSIRTTFFQDARVWLKAVFAEKNSFYVRLKNNYITVRDTSARYNGIGDDYDGPHLDLAYLNLAIASTSRLVIGRQNFYVGKGIAYNRVHDGIQAELNKGRAKLKLFCARTKPHENHLDFSIPGYDKEGWQLFSGIEASFQVKKDLTPYLYFLHEKDHPKEHPIDRTQDYNYNASFVGTGFRAQSFKNLAWFGELIKEFGESYTDSYSVTPEKKNINAWASVVGGKYSFECRTHPDIDLEYAWGSGDKDRQSTTNTAAGGNRLKNDTGFQYFGYYFNGYRLDTRLSNIHIFRFGASFTPCEKSNIGKNILVGTKFFIFRKDKKGAGIYEDTPTPGLSRDIGKEIDCYLYWQLTPQLTWAARYGVFFPGRVYTESTNDSTQYFNTFLTYRF